MIPAAPAVAAACAAARARWSPVPPPRPAPTATANISPPPRICGSCSFTCWTAPTACARPTRGGRPCRVFAARSARTASAAANSPAPPPAAIRPVSSALFAEAVTAARAARPTRVAPPDAGPGHRQHLSDALGHNSAPGAEHGGHAPGVRVQTGFDLADAIPRALHLTLADTHDTTALRARDLTRAGRLDGADRSRLLRPPPLRRVARGRGLVHLPAAPAGRLPRHRRSPGPPDHHPRRRVVLADQTITLGSPNNRAGACCPGCASSPVATRAGGPRFVTDRVDLAAADVVALYRKRWQIELFFRWLKYQLKRAPSPRHTAARRSG